MEKPSRFTGVIAYLLPLIGPLFILLLYRKRPFALYHACQSLAITLAAILLPLAWAIVSWSISWIPLVGPVLVVSLFALVLATWLFVLITLIMGIINALNGLYRRVPIFGQWGERLFFRLHTAEETVAPPEGQEAAV